MTIYLIGLLFTMGILVRIEKGADEKLGVWVFIGAIFIWPYTLGRMLLLYLEEKEKNNEPEGH